jgi:hypothetical protein
LSDAYNPDDPVQNNFLSILALGETGANGSYTEGYGGVDLSGASTDQYGFPQYGGSVTSAGPTHPAGLFQFEPGTWDSVASSLGLNNFSPSSQNEAAWQYAQTTYANATGGDLETALQSGQFSSVQHALASVWPSLNGNASEPGGFAAYEASGGTGSSAYTGAGGGGGSGAGGGSAAGAGQSSTSPSLGFLGSITDVEQFFVRGGILIIGGVVILVALWQLLSEHTDIPSPVETAKGIGQGASGIVAAAVA